MVFDEEKIWFVMRRKMVVSEAEKFYVIEAKKISFSEKKLVDNEKKKRTFGHRVGEGPQDKWGGDKANTCQPS